MAALSVILVPPTIILSSRFMKPVNRLPTLGSDSAASNHSTRPPKWYSAVYAEEIVALGKAAKNSLPKCLFLFPANSCEAYAALFVAWARIVPTVYAVVFSTSSRQ